MQHPKGVLIERCKQLRLGKPDFETLNTGPEHEPHFESEVQIGGEVLGRGAAGSKRDAERIASEEALAALATSLHARAGQGVSTASQTEPQGPFVGPWPIFAEVLAASLTVAGGRVNPMLMGEAAVTEVQALALQLYKGTLEALGEVLEVDEEDSSQESGVRGQ